ncbi:MAG: FAD-binding protein [Planctomycetaceae bacterium]|nr:FAD-binding protein [Planctomycetaceae bacterium]
MSRWNFGHNVLVQPSVCYTPATEAEVLEILDRHRGQRIRCCGRLHSWSPVLQTEDVLLDLRELRDVRVEQHAGEPVVHVGAGCQVKRLLAELEQQQLTLPSVGFITEQSIAGAIATGTHGSGRHSLSHYVVAVRVAIDNPETGAAQICEINSGDELRAARCSLGLLGVVLSVTMQCRTPYCVEEQFREYRHVRDVLAAEDEFPLQQFYLIPWRWSCIAQHRREVDGPPTLLGVIYRWYRFLTFDVLMHWYILLLVHIIGSPAVIRFSFRRLIPALVVRNWPAVGPSSKQMVMEHELFRHGETELFVQRHRLDEAIEYVRQLITSCGEADAPVTPEFEAQIDRVNAREQWQMLRGTYCHHFPICVRKVLPDDTLISMASNIGIVASIDGGGEFHAESPAAVHAPMGPASPTEPWYAITFTNYHPRGSHLPFDQFVALLLHSMHHLFGARAHWGKLCPLPVADLTALYPEFSKFRAIVAGMNPAARFQNQWTRELLESGLREP